ncbi:MAG: tryptophan 7-halogenase, partial [Halieaceae bacterium]
NVLSESVRQLLDVWYRGGDLGAEIRRQDFDSHFGSSSWHCLLAGYGVFPELAPEQPGRGDLFVAHEIGPLFEGCCMNFVTQTEALANLR